MRLKARIRTTELFIAKKNVRLKYAASLILEHNWEGELKSEGIWGNQLMTFFDVCSQAGSSIKTWRTSAVTGTEGWKGIGALYCRSPWSLNVFFFDIYVFSMFWIFDRSTSHYDDRFTVSLITSSQIGMTQIESELKKVQHAENTKLGFETAWGNIRSEKVLPLKIVPRDDRCSGLSRMDSDDWLKMQYLQTETVSRVLKSGMLIAIRCGVVSMMTS